MNTELKEKERIAMERLKAFEPEDGYFLAYSGGKDSDCIKILTQLAGVKFEAVHNLTTVDAPETVRYIKSQLDVRIDRPYCGRTAGVYSSVGGGGRDAVYLPH